MPLIIAVYMPERDLLIKRGAHILVFTAPGANRRAFGQAAIRGAKHDRLA
jgi:hypothetical protein